MGYCIIVSCDPFYTRTTFAKFAVYRAARHKIAFVTIRYGYEPGEKQCRLPIDTYTQRTISTTTAKSPRLRNFVAVFLTGVQKRAFLPNERFNVKVLTRTKEKNKSNGNRNVLRGIIKEEKLS